MDLFLTIDQYKIKLQNLNGKGYNPVPIPNQVSTTIHGKTWYLVYSGSKDVTGCKRVGLFFKSLAHTLFTLGIALKSPKLRDHWSTVFHGKKVRQIFADQQNLNFPSSHNPLSLGNDPAASDNDNSEETSSDGEQEFSLHFPESKDNKPSQPRIEVETAALLEEPDFDSDEEDFSDVAELSHSEDLEAPVESTTALSTDEVEDWSPEDLGAIWGAVKSKPRSDLDDSQLRGATIAKIRAVWNSYRLAQQEYAKLANAPLMIANPVHGRVLYQRITAIVEQSKSSPRYSPLTDKEFEGELQKVLGTLDKVQVCNMLRDAKSYLDRVQGEVYVRTNTVLMQSLALQRKD